MVRARVRFRAGVGARVRDSGRARVRARVSKVCGMPRVEVSGTAKAEGKSRDMTRAGPGYNAQSSLHKGVRVLNPSKLGFTEHSPTAEI